MSAYLSLITWTDQGIRNVKDTVNRARAVEQALQAAGGRKIGIWWTQGPYDAVFIFEAPDDETATRLLLAAGTQGNVHTDPGDNCIPSCLSQAQSSGLCSGMTGPQCEQSVNWYMADGGRFGCLARVRVTNPKNGKSAVLVALDYGPSCTVENNAGGPVIDMSVPAITHLFGGEQGWADHAAVHAVEVDGSTPLGPV